MPVREVDVKRVFGGRLEPSLAAKDKRDAKGRLLPGNINVRECPEFEQKRDKDAS